MSSTRIEIDLAKLEHNAAALSARYANKGIGITAVTKGACGSPMVAAAFLRGGITSLGDARLPNLRRMREAGIDAEYMLIRPPRLSEAERVVRLADISLNTETTVVRRLAACARRQGRQHRVILMVELGDLREGVLPSHLDAVVSSIRCLKGVSLIGIGANLACLNGIMPTRAKMDALSDMTERVEHVYGLPMRIVSGGNSANHNWLQATDDTGRINHLRIGEALLLGSESLQRHPVDGLAADAFCLVGEVVEVKIKPSMPYGRAGQDAFGREPDYHDIGDIRRAIIALGEQDLDPEMLYPRGQAVVLGASSDQLVLHDKSRALHVGQEVRFGVGYGTLLRAMTSPYVEKRYIRRESSATPGEKALTAGAGQAALGLAAERVGSDRVRNVGLDSRRRRHAQRLPPNWGGSC